MSGPTVWSVAFAGIRFHRKIFASIAAGVAIATAVIVGALLVGDSMRGSLRDLTLQRLGTIEYVVTPGTFFQSETLLPQFRDRNIAGILLFDRSVAEAGDAADRDRIRRAGNVQVVGCDESFWRFDTVGLNPPTLDENSVLINQSLAIELGVEKGDQLTLRIPREQAIPADSPLGRSEAETESIPRLKVVDILPDRGLGRFSLLPSQTQPLIAFVQRQSIADLLDRAGSSNVLLVGGDASSQTSADKTRETATAISEALQLDAETLGIQVDLVEQKFKQRGEEESTAGTYINITSSRLMLPQPAVDAIEQAFPEAVPAMTYLANGIDRFDEKGTLVASLPYSTITAVDDSSDLPLTFEFPDQSSMEKNVPLVLNQWAADQLKVSVGDRLRVAYFEPEEEQGKEIEKTLDAVVTQIVPLTQPATKYRRRRTATFDQPPTPYNAPDLTPSVPGVTDQDSVSDWDLPFPQDRETNRQDDEYFEYYRLTPKAFIPLAEGRQRFGSRFGDTTNLRLSVDAEEFADEASESSSKYVDQIQQQVVEAVASKRVELGFGVRPIRLQQLNASAGTTPFDGLFLSLSFFVIMAAVLLIAMLFRLGVVGRTTEFGTLIATGWFPSSVRGLAIREGFLISCFGMVLGLLGGLLYAYLVLEGLRSYWVGAVTVPFLTFHWTYRSLLIGGTSSLLIAILTIRWTTSQLASTSPQTLLRGNLEEPEIYRTATTSFWQRWMAGSRLIIVAAMMSAVGVIVIASGLAFTGQQQAGAFVGGGMMLLMAALMFVFAKLNERSEQTSASAKVVGGLFPLAVSNISRSAVSSTLAIGLMASACFLIVSIGAFRLTPSDAGTGQFPLIGKTASPIYRDLADASVRDQLIGSRASELEDATIVPLRTRLGQDASCNNLYKALQPTVYGIPPAMMQGTVQDHFAWIAVGEKPEPSAPAWNVLDRPANGTEQDPIPMILDQNTALWSLQMYGGVGETKSFDFGEGPVFFRVAGLLDNSVLQGSLLISETNFQNRFQNINGYQTFLIRTIGDEKKQKNTQQVLESRLGDVGMDVADSRLILSRLMAVQNTYLRTFQSLGALGLLLGTIGLAIAQMRSVLERRKEFAVMRAIGFPRWRLAQLVMVENFVLLSLGIGCGVVSAVISVLPFAVAGKATPPLWEPLLVVAGIFLIGSVAGFLAARRVFQLPLLTTLRGR